MNDQNAMIRKLIELKSEYSSLSVEHWLKYEIFTWVWWLELFFVIAPLIVWWKLVDKKRIREIVIFGLLICVQAVTLDFIGSEFALWVYPIRLFPNALLIFPADTIFLPVVFMLIYQYFIKWKNFLLVIILGSTVLSFVLEPISVMINQYILLSWRFAYSFPVYILAAIAARLITEKFIQKGNCS